MTIRARALWHPAITDAIVEDACRRRLCSLDNPGFCLACGVEADSCEPDAQNYECENCGEAEVFGCDELLMEIA